MTLGEIIRQYREKNGINMGAFADRCNLSKGYISMIENNINPRNGKPIVPSLDTIKQISHGMGIELNALLDRMDDSQEVDISPNSEPMKNLKEARIIKGLTEEELGRIVNVKKSTIAKFESGKVQPSQEILVKIARVLGVSTDYLLGITNKAFSNTFSGITHDEVEALLKKTEDSDTVVISVTNYGGNNAAFKMPRKDFEEWLKVKNQIPADEMDELIELKKKIDRQIQEFKEK